jgi:hypothetical protein
VKRTSVLDCFNELHGALCDKGERPQTSDRQFASSQRTFPNNINSTRLRFEEVNGEVTVLTRVGDASENRVTEMWNCA